MKFSLRPAAARLMVLQVVLIPVGFMPVLCISLNVLQLLPLHMGVWLLALPAALFAAVAGWLHPPLGRILLRGWLWGIVAVALYDLGRVPFVLSGWRDFIPRIGEWLLNRQGVPGIIGYAWRYLGNGGGMGMSFLLLLEWLKPEDKHIHIGVGYGLFVFL